MNLSFHSRFKWLKISDLTHVGGSWQQLRNMALASSAGVGAELFLLYFKSHFYNVSSCSECSPNSNIIIFTQTWKSFFSLLCNSIIFKFQISTHSLFRFLPPIFYSMVPGRINAWFPTNVSDDSTLSSSFLLFSRSSSIHKSSYSDNQF